MGPFDIRSAAAVHRGGRCALARRLQCRRQDAQESRGGDQWEGLSFPGRRAGRRRVGRARARIGRGAQDHRIPRKGVPRTGPPAGERRRLPPGRGARGDHASDQKLSFQQGRGWHDAGLRRRHGDRHAPRAPGILDRGQRSRICRLWHRRARIRLERLRRNRHARQDRADPGQRPGIRDRRGDAVSRQGHDLPRALDLQVRGSRAPGRGSRDHHP